jgi:hypothetical protein
MMKKYVFWGVIHNNWNIAFDETLSHYAQGETFWKAMKHLAADMPTFVPSPAAEETDLLHRQKMFFETGVNRVELVIEAEPVGPGKGRGEAGSEQSPRFAVRCANSRSSFDARDEREALCKYIERRADTSRINTGG